MAQIPSTTSRQSQFKPCPRTSITKIMDHVNRCKHKHLYKTSVLQTPQNRIRLFLSLPLLQHRNVRLANVILPKL